MGQHKYAHIELLQVFNWISNQLFNTANTYGTNKDFIQLTLILYASRNATEQKT